MSSSEGAVSQSGISSMSATWRTLDINRRSDSGKYWQVLKKWDRKPESRGHRIWWDVVCRQVSEGMGV